MNSNFIKEVSLIKPNSVIIAIGKVANTRWLLLAMELKTESIFGSSETAGTLGGESKVTWELYNSM